MQSCLEEHNASRLGKQEGGGYGSIGQAVCGCVPFQVHLCSLDKQRLSLAAKAALQDTWALIGHRSRSTRTAFHRQCHHGPILRQEEHIQKMWAAVEGLENQVGSKTNAICHLFSERCIQLLRSSVCGLARWSCIDGLHFTGMFVLSAAATFLQVHSDHKELFQVSRNAKEQGFDLSSEPM